MSGSTPGVRLGRLAPISPANTRGRRRWASRMSLWLRAKPTARFFFSGRLRPAALWMFSMMFSLSLWRTSWMTRVTGALPEDDSAVASPRCRAEGLAVTLGDCLAARRVVLAATMGNLDRAHDLRQSSVRRPVQAIGDAVEQAGAIGIAAAGRIDDLVSLDAGDVVALAGIAFGAFATTGNDQRLHFAGQLLQAAPGAVAEQFCLVVVEAGVVGVVHEIHQLVAAEHRHALTRIEDEGHAGFGEVAGVLHHPLATVRCDNAQLGTGTGHLVQMRETHRPGVEGGDLVVVEVGRDEGLGGKTAGDLAHVRARQAELVEAVKVRPGIVADGGHDNWLATQQHQVVGDVAGTTAEFTTHFRHQESNVQDMNLFGQDVVLETDLEDHDVVKSQRTANQFCHEKAGVKEIKAIAAGADVACFDPQLDGK